MYGKLWQDSVWTFFFIRSCDYFYELLTRQSFVAWNCLSKKLTTFDCIHHWAAYFKIVFYQSILQIWSTVKSISCNVFISSKPTNQSSSMHQKYQCQTTSTWHQQHSSQIKVTTQFPDQSNNTVPRSKYQHSSQTRVTTQFPYQSNNTVPRPK